MQRKTGNKENTLDTFWIQSSFVLFVSSLGQVKHASFALIYDKALLVSRVGRDTLANNEGIDMEYPPINRCALIVERTLSKCLSLALITGEFNQLYEVLVLLLLAQQSILY